MPESADQYLDVTHRTVHAVAVTELTFDRPEKLNAMPAGSLDALVDCLGDITPDSTDAVVLTGAGGEFCVGVDVSELADSDADGHAAAADRMHRLVDAIRSCPVPVVASVPGRAFGAGFLACMAADIVLADEDAAFGLQEVDLGIPVAGYATTILPRLVGEHRAREWLFTGETISASDAADAGFVGHVATDDSLESVESRYLRELGASSSSAIALLKSRMASPTAPTDQSALREREASDIETAFETGDAEERIRDLLE